MCETAALKELVDRLGDAACRAEGTVNALYVILGSHLELAAKTFGVPKTADVVAIEFLAEEARVAAKAVYDRADELENLLEGRAPAGEGVT